MSALGSSRTALPRLLSDNTGTTNTMHLKFYLTFLVSFVTLTGGAQPVPAVSDSADAAAASLGYSSVAHALQSIRSKPGVSVNLTQPDGWTIVTEPSPVLAVWSFTPVNHPANPSVVRRKIQQDSTGNVSVAMVVMCEAPKEPCDQLVQDFQLINERMSKGVRRRLE